MLRDLFSIRYKPELDNKSIDIRLDSRLKHRLCAVIKLHDDSYEVWDGNSYYTSRSEEALKYALDCLGQKEVYTYHGGDDRRVAEWLRDVINNGWAPNALDCLEAFYWELPEEKRAAYCDDVNAAFEISASPLRVMAGLIIKIDSAWLTRHVISQATSLLTKAGFSGPLDEFRKAVKAHQTKNTKDAIYLADHALESTEKAILGVKHEKPGRLLRQIVDSGIVPDYCEGFLKCFEPFFASVNGIRHETPGAGHGQGADEATVPPEVSELMLHLTGSLIVFLIKLHIQRENSVSQETRREAVGKTQ